MKPLEERDGPTGDEGIPGVEEVPDEEPLKVDMLLPETAPDGGGYVVGGVDGL